jgi:hypothetical protein
LSSDNVTSKGDCREEVASRYGDDPAPCLGIKVDERACVVMGSVVIGGDGEVCISHVVGGESDVGLGRWVGEGGGCGLPYIMAICCIWSGCHW